MTWQQAAAIVVPAVIGAALRHGISTSIAGLLSAVLDALAKAADQVGKGPNAVLLALTFSAALQLAACESDGSAGPPHSFLFAYQVACGTYSQAKAPLVVAEQLGVFDPAGEKVLAESMAGADQVCASSTPPADPNAAIALVSQAAAAVLTAVAQAHGKLPVPTKS